jgi:hypothetical protein
MAELSMEDLRQITHALLRESVSSVSVMSRGTFVDFGVTSLSALGLEHRQRFRLFPHLVSALDLRRLQEEAAAVGLDPVAVAPLGIEKDIVVPPGVRMIDAKAFDRLCEQSGVIVYDERRRPCVDRTAWRELRDQTNARFPFVNGLLWLRPLSRNRVPPALRRTGRPAHELFEGCFFLTMTTTFRASGVSWGTKKRGEPIPDGVLHLPGVAIPVLYDCKAAHDGYSMTYQDLRGFADYLQHPPEVGWTCPADVVPRFLVISSEIHDGSRQASFKGRQKALDRKVPGARLTWMRAPDLVRFGLAIEAAEVLPAHREAIAWGALLDAGNVHWEVFRTELVRLAELGYTFRERD